MINKIILVIIIICVCLNGQAQIITTIAGSGDFGEGTGGYSGDGGPATNALLGMPIGLTFDDIGNLYFVDEAGQWIRKIDTTGIITTIAGTGVYGCAGEGVPATDASFSDLTGYICWHDGMLYIPDGECSRIRAINAHGIITTIAGNGTGGNSGNGGPASAAVLDGPIGITYDKHGNLYEIEVGSILKKIDTANIINVVAGKHIYGFSGDGGPADSASFSWPLDVTLDNKGNIYVTDMLNNRVRKIDTNNIITTFAGCDTLAGYSGDNGPASAAKLYFPHGIIADDVGNIYFTDENNFVIRKVDTNGIITTIVGTGTEGFSGDGGPATAAQLDKPADLVFDKYGNLYFTDWWNNRIRKVTNVGVMNPVSVASPRPSPKEREDVLHIYPNPAGSELFVEGVVGCQIAFFDVVGSEKLKVKSEKLKTVVDISCLAKGVYFVEVVNLETGLKVVRKLLKE